MKVIKKSLYKIVFVLTVSLIGTACEKVDPIYVDDARVNFWMLEDMVNNLGSKVYSNGFTFAAMPDHVMKDTVMIRVKTMGPIEPFDRIFKAEADADATTAVLHTDYQILDGVVKANSYIGYLPVVLIKTVDLKTTTKNLSLILTDNGSFKPGVKEDMRFLIYFNDALVMPSNWNVLATYFGAYSEVKYKFIIQVLGRSDFPVVTSAYKEGLLTNYQMLDMKNVLKDALTIYNNTHPEPMRDEFNTLVTFP